MTTAINLTYLSAIPNLADAPDHDGTQVHYCLETYKAHTDRIGALSRIDAKNFELETQRSAQRAKTRADTFFTFALGIAVAITSATYAFSVLAK